VQAVAGIPLTVYGKGNQVRGYLNLLDTLQCVELAMDNPADQGELRILNQFTETFSVNALAEQVQRVGNQMDLNVEVKSIENPRKEAEDHYYNPALVAAMLERIVQYRDRIDKNKILPRVRWK